jgi:hypothetical protein
MLYERRSASQKSMGMLIQQSLVGMGSRWGRWHPATSRRRPDSLSRHPAGRAAIGNPRFDL